MIRLDDNIQDDELRVLGKPSPEEPKKKKTRKRKKKAVAVAA